MPRLNGYEVAAALRAQETAEHRFILIAHTARTERADIETAHRAGFDHHVAKPQQSGGLRALIHASLDLIDRQRRPF